MSLAPPAGRSRVVRRARLACAVLLALAATNAGAQGAACRLPDPVVTLPLDAGQGGAGAGRDAPPKSPPLYLAALRFAPTLGIGCDRRATVAAVGGLHVVGRTARPMGGGAIGVRLLRPTALGGLVSAPLFLSGEALWGRGRTLASGALTLDLLRVLRVTGRGGRDLAAHRTFGEIAVGTDLGRWLGTGTPRRGPPPPSPVADLDSFPRFLAVRMANRASWLLDADARPQLDSARAIVDDAERAPTVRALQSLVATRGPRRLAATLAQVLDDAVLARTGRAQTLAADDPAFQRTLVGAIVRGWRTAMTP
jgi:hypothetical protein